MAFDKDLEGGLLVVFKWIEINCSVSEPLFFEGG